jgi:hypothetical protein
LQVNSHFWRVVHSLTNDTSVLADKLLPSAVQRVALSGLCPMQLARVTAMADCFSEEIPLAFQHVITYELAPDG